MGNLWSYRAHKARLLTSNVRFVINRSFLIFFWFSMIHLSSTDYCVYYTYCSKWWSQVSIFFKRVYISLTETIHFVLWYLLDWYIMEFCCNGWCRSAANRFNELSMWNFVGYLNIMCFPLAKKTIFTLKSAPFFARGCSKTIFLGFRKGHKPFDVNGDGTRLRQWLILLLLCTFVVFVRHLELMQIWTECPVLKKVEIILFFGSEKLKKCTNDIPNYANFEG